LAQHSFLITTVSALEKKLSQHSGNGDFRNPVFIASFGTSRTITLHRRSHSKEQASPKRRKNPVLASFDLNCTK
jgi:hypothetical protein